MADMRGDPDITFTDDDTAVVIRYRVTADHSVTIPLDELPFDVEEAYAEFGEGLTNRGKLDVLGEAIEADLEAVVADRTEFGNADGYDYELTFIRRH